MRLLRWRSITPPPRSSRDSTRRSVLPVPPPTSPASRGFSPARVCPRPPVLRLPSTSCCRRPLRCIGFTAIILEWDPSINSHGLCKGHRLCLPFIHNPASVLRRRVHRDYIQGQEHRVLQHPCNINSIPNDIPLLRDLTHLTVIIS